MLKVLKPNKNKQTQGYSETHKGYDHSGKGDQNYYSSFYGKVVQAKNSETENWLNEGKLTTNDYGNYIKIKGEVDGETYHQLGAHFKQGTVLPVGTEVKRGQVVAQIGNTGNSTAAHSHTEYRDKDNKNIRVEFVENQEETNEMEKLPKDSVLRDFYRAVKVEFSDDEINRWLQENKNLYEIFTSVFQGDGAAKKHLLELWGIEIDINWEETAKGYIDTFNMLKEIYGLSPSDDTEKVLGKARGSQERIKELENQVKELEKKKTPETIYKYQDKDYQLILKISNLILALEK